MSEMSSLIRFSEELRQVLQRYEDGGVTMADRLEQGESLADALDAAKGPVRRKEVTDAMKRFERTRHQVRLLMFQLAAEQGTTASELGRQLGISRQLASRLSREAAVLSP